MDTADSRPPDTAERLFAEFLSGNSQAKTIDGLAAAHPELADRLRSLAAKYAAGDPQVTGSAAEPASPAHSELARLLERLRRRGPDGLRFRMQWRLGAGGMGEVSVAHDEDLRRDFAIKQIGTPDRDGRSATPDNPDSQLRFLAEAQTIGQLEHPGIPPVHEVGMQPDGRLYFAMRRVRGQPLAKVLEARPAWPQARLLAVVQKVCETMAYAHRKNVIHRDLKPDNVMVGEFGEVYVIDWGLARALGDTNPHAEVVRTLRTPQPKIAADPGASDPDPGLTRDGEIVGTPNFMPPEQAAGNITAVDKRSDIYSVGAILYQLITGSVPYGKGTPEKILVAVRAGPPPAPATVAPNAPKDLQAICARAMARKPTDRYGSMQELADDLRHYLEGHAVQARQISRPARAWRWARRNPALATTGGLLAGAVGFALMVLWWWVDKSAEAAELQRVLAKTEVEIGEVPTPTHLPEALASSISTLQLDSLQQTVNDLLGEVDSLWPAQPQKIPELERWVQRAQLLLAGRRGDPLQGDLGQPGLLELRQRLEALRQRAKPRSASDQRKDEAAHPRFAEAVRLRARATWAARMLGKEDWPPLLPAAEVLGDGPLSDNCEELRQMAEHLGDPDATPYDQLDRAVALIERALQFAKPDQRALVLATQAMIRLKCGDFTGARSTADQALAVATPQNRMVVTGITDRVAQHLADWTVRRADREKQYTSWTNLAEHVEREVRTPRTFLFADAADQREHEQLARVVEALSELNHPERGHLREIMIHGQGHSVAFRLKSARSIPQRTLHGPDAIRGWGIAIPAIRASPLYGGLDLRPQLGLLPVGEDPESGLWVFWHLASGNFPRKGGEGPETKWTPSPADGITFVLIPGGRFHKGAQRVQPGEPGYDPEATPPEGPVQAADVEPFFLAKHEVTQLQWYRLTGTEPSQFNLSGYDQAWNQGHLSWNGMLPVERLSWHDCDRILTRHGLTLPTDKQWEYAYRAGTTTPFPTGSDPLSLRGFGNLADQFGGKYQFTTLLAWLEDGNAVTARVGSYKPNAFGLHDMVGNVSEWVLDVPLLFGRASSDQNVGEKRTRGGHWRSLTDMARCAHWADMPADSRTPEIGVRPARAIDH